MSFEDRLRHELQRADAALPIVGLDLGQVLTKGRAARRRALGATTVAAAAVVFAGIAGGAVLTRDGDVHPPQPPVATPSGTVRPDPIPTASDSLPADERPSFDRVETVLRTWLQAIQDGDENRAWELMTTEAQTIVGRDGFNDMMASALPQGLGAFADASDFSYVVMSSEDGDARLVGVVSGEISREGNDEFAAIAIPMRIQEGETRVDDPVVGRDRYYDRVAVFASASAGPFPARAGDELIVEFASPGRATEVLIAVDEDRRPLPTRFDAERGEARATLDRDLKAGRHIATVVVVHESSRLYPEAIIFTTAAP
ncbi:MAG: hypothetical protein M3277_12245 [Actinomycetota bacterium]|nr:hypothetical protein [Actinomycetota bacterium]